MRLKKNRNISIISGLVFFSSYVLSYLNILKPDLAGYKNLFEFIIFIVFVLSTLILFIKLDIKQNKFVYLKTLNYLTLITGLALFLYWGFIKPNTWYLIFPMYSIGLLVINSMIISFVYFIKKFDKSFVIKQWLLIIFMFLFYLYFHRVLKIFGIVIFETFIPD